MSPATKPTTKRGPAQFFRRIESKLGVNPLHSDKDLARVVEQRLSLSSIDSLTQNGMTIQEIYALVAPRRTLAHRKSRRELLTQEESDRLVRVARIASLAEEVFGDDAKAGRWLRKPKSRFDGKTPFELLFTEAGARMVEEMLLQLDYGFTA